DLGVSDLGVGVGVGVGVGDVSVGNLGLGDVARGRFGSVLDGCALAGLIVLVLVLVLVIVLVLVLVIVIVLGGGGPLLLLALAALDPTAAVAAGGGRAARRGRPGLVARRPPGQLVRRHAVDDDGDVAGALVDAARPAPGAGPPALQGGALVSEAGHDAQRREVLLALPAVGDADQAGGLRSVGRGRLEDLQDVAGHGPLGEGQGG